ncbi:macrophage mannose receptor 1 isoform X1 [Ixodes scapularis]
MAKSPAKPAPKAFGTLGTGRILEPVYDRSAAAYIRELSTPAVRWRLIPLAPSSMRRFFRRLVAGMTQVYRTRRRSIVSGLRREDFRSATMVMMMLTFLFALFLVAGIPTLVRKRCRENKQRKAAASVIAVHFVNSHLHGVEPALTIAEGQAHPMPQGRGAGLSTSSTGSQH